MRSPITVVLGTIFVVLALAAFPARADDEIDTPQKSRLMVAGDPDPDPEPPFLPTPSRDGAGPRLTFGRALTQDLEDGFFGRFETEYFEVTDIYIRGMLLGLEGWGSPDGGGGAIPISAYWGIRAPLYQSPKSPALFLSLGLGFDCVLFDYVRHDGGFGLFAPFATGVAGFEIFPGGRILVDARAAYRWQWDAADRYQFRLGISLAVNSDWWDSPSGGP